MRIVIVDGSAEDRAAIECAVLSSGAPACELEGAASNGKDGYELIRAKRPDLVIMEMKLPRMNGLTMLRKLREENISFRVLVLTTQTDFPGIRQAIQLGVDDYLLKPVKKAQLQKSLKDIGDKMSEKQAKEAALTVDNIFMGCLNGQLRLNADFHNMTKERYGFSLEDPGALFVVRIGNGYAEQREKAGNLLGNAGRGNGFAVCVLPVDAWHMLAVVVYRSSNPGGRENEKAAESFAYEYEVFRDHIVPSLSGNIRGEIVCLWEETEHMSELPEALRRLRRIREWNLLFDRGEVIRRKDIEALDVVPLKYPAELESRMRQAVLASNGEEIKKCYYGLYDIFRREPHSPRDMKECLIRFNMAVLGAYKTQHEIQSELSIQYSLQGIADAMSWAGIRSAMEQFLNALDFDAFVQESDGGLSPLIKKAVQLVRKYYDQGITLEEMATRLFVSEEYLSAQFKKETGKGFAETVRNLRIERIKELLVNTRLKLNQIAELTGYTDPKYMSRVFKDEVGMLPTEFRKSAH